MSESNTCPVCDMAASDVSWSTAPGQAVCTNQSCPVNTWDDRVAYE